jgi:hypothetical protein
MRLHALRHGADERVRGRGFLKTRVGARQGVRALLKIAGQNDDLNGGELRLRSEMINEFLSRHDGHVEIENDTVGEAPVRSQPRQGVLTVACRMHVVVGDLQQYLISKA